MGISLLWSALLHDTITPIASCLALKKRATKTILFLFFLSWDFLVSYNCYKLHTIKERWSIFLGFSYHPLFKDNYLVSMLTQAISALPKGIIRHFLIPKAKFLQRPTDSYKGPPRPTVSHFPWWEFAQFLQKVACSEIIYTCAKISNFVDEIKYSCENDNTLCLSICNISHTIA